jgi:hypothetical protein
MADITKMSLKTGKEHISFSEGKLFEGCSYAHNLKHIKKLDFFEENVYTNFGTAIHASCEDYLETREMKYEIALDLIRKFWKKHNLPEVGLWMKRANIILEAVPGWLEDRFPGWEAVRAEEELMEPIPGVHTNTKFKGFIDAIIKYKGEYWLLDWKGQRLTAPILTPNGWVKMGDLEVGSIITNSCGDSCKVVGVFPLGKRDVYRVKMNDGTFTDTTYDHLWEIQKELSRKHPKYCWIDVLSKPAMFNGLNKFDIDPYLMGCLLGDGTLGSSIRITTKDIEIINNIKNMGYLVGKPVDSGGSRTPTYTLYGLPQKMKRYGLLGKKSFEKFVPEEYKWSSPKLRLKLIQGLLDTDGWVQKGIAKLSTTSSQLAQDMRDLVHSLGGVTFISSRPIRTCSNYKEFVVTVRLPSEMQPFSLKRKVEKVKSSKRKLHRRIESIEKIGEDEMQCIKVDAKDSLYVTNDFILTHNTAANGWSDWKRKDESLKRQLVYYNIFWSEKHNIPHDKINCGFVILNRDLDAEERIDFFTFKVTEKDRKKSLNVLNNMIGHIKHGRSLKIWKYSNPRYQGACRFCDYNGTKYCP